MGPLLDYGRPSKNHSLPDGSINFFIVLHFGRSRRAFLAQVVVKNIAATGMEMT